MNNGFFVGEALGEIARPPTLRHTDNNTAVLSINLLILKQRDGGDPSKTYLDCAVWGKQAEEWDGRLNQGDTVLIRGDMRPRMVKRRKDNVEYWTFNLHAGYDGITVISGGVPAPAAGNPAYPPSRPGGYDDDPCPF